ncbi:MAG: hypothetical protein KBB91_00760 [Candidatus Pacebacteria bacterium]|jgi:hypothetical protein|nr:hypothetical protein [Candidatus Paceibacterota bacterium]MBP9700937.1 hypothetical protein [Candidatus Paceibacterota bacterium]
MNIIEKNTWPETSFEELYVKSAPPGSYSQRYVGDVLLGCFFGPKFSLEEIANFGESRKKEYPDPENLYEFYCGGNITFNLSDIVLLDGTQFNAYKGKMIHGADLNLRDKEGCWLNWDPYMRKLYIDDPRQKQREALERKKVSQ